MEFFELGGVTHLDRGEISVMWSSSALGRCDDLAPSTPACENNPLQSSARSMGAGFSQAPKAPIGDRQEQVGVAEFGLHQSLLGLRKSAQYQIRPAPAVVVEPTQCWISRRGLVSPLKWLI